MSGERKCDHGEGYVCGLCMGPSPDVDPYDCGHDPDGGDCDYDCPRFAHSSAGF